MRRSGVTAAAMVLAAGLVLPLGQATPGLAQEQGTSRHFSCTSLPDRISLEELRRRAASAQTANPVLTMAWNLKHGLDGAPYDPAEALRFYRIVMERSARFAAGTLGDINWRTAASASRALMEKGVNGGEIDFTAIEAIYREEEARGLDVSGDRARTHRMKPAYADYLRAVELDMAGKSSVAPSLFRRAAEGGIVDAMFRLGHYYQTGRHGSRVDRAEARKWFEAAAREDHADAMYFLGGLLLDEDQRRGATRDGQMASLHWMHQAARRDHAYAMMAVGIGHQKGMGVLLANKDEADCWYRRAIALGNDHDDSRAEARRLLNTLR